MREKVPVVEFPEEYSCHGRISAGGRPFECHFRVWRGKYRHWVPWSFRLQIVDAQEQGWWAAQKDVLDFYVEGVTQTGERIQFRVRPTSFHYPGGVEGDIVEMDLGHASLRSLPTGQWITVQLSHTPLALSQSKRFVRSPQTGELMGEDLQDVFVWRCSLGEGRLRMEYEFEKVEVDAATALVRVDRPTLTIPLLEESFTTDTYQLIDGMIPQLNDLARLLGFLSRRRVDWWSVTVTSTLPAENTSEHWLHTRRGRQTVALPDAQPQHLTELLDTRGAPRDAIDRMYHRWRGLGYHEAIRHGIGFLLGSYEDGFMETQLTSAFTALEAVVNGIGETDGSAYTMGEEEFRALKAFLQASIKQYGREHPAVDASIRDALYRKLGELRRTPFIPRAVRLLEEHVEWRDLWPDGTTLETALKAAYERRSRLVHTGRWEKPELADADQIRIHAVAERLIFALIGGQREWISGLAYRFRNYAAQSPVQ